MMKLKNIYRPIERELLKVEEILASSLKKTENNSISRINNYLLGSPGKRIRPALMILAAKATLNNKQESQDQHLLKIASSIELIHMASLVHDDVIDHSSLRHNKPTINSKWGDDVSIALGDYLYSLAFELASDCTNPDIIRSISSATKQMCEGELLQVCERENMDLLKERYIVIVKKKTAMLFAASCQVGSLIYNGRKSLQCALRDYGLNFGIAFQIIDDHLDLVGDQEKLGKTIGQDVGVGEITLPILSLFESIAKKDKRELKRLLTSKRYKESLSRIKSQIITSNAANKTKEAASSYISLAKKRIDVLSSTPYKESLINLADFIMERGFNGSSAC